MFLPHFSARFVFLEVSGGSRPFLPQSGAPAPEPVVIEEPEKLEESWDLDSVLGEETPLLAVEPEKVGEPCPDCGGDLLIKLGRFGKFIGCSSYPKCKFIESLDQPEDTGVQCPKCHKGTLVKRKSRRGKRSRPALAAWLWASRNSGR